MHREVPVYTLYIQGNTSVGQTEHLRVIHGCILLLLDDASCCHQFCSVVFRKQQATISRSKVEVCPHR